ncbi:MAG: marC integral membrane family protein [Legionellales bacterium]|nr:marC integral membrane family protein [Legionellales bacterium]OUX66868.1 MAG: hypothetical protein CBD38_03850 [bacterium TMED178]|tara:strand:- start:4909 stop:5538 length:630 start_codon:yes stop_codon:yes gene_type:complete
MGYQDLVMYFTTMFAMTNPFGGVGIFLGLVGDQPITTQRQIARKTAFSCFIILLVVTFLGASILNLFGIKIYALQLAGGLIITLMGLHMLQSNQTSMHQVDQDPKQNKTPDIAVVPMSLPLITGPGAMTVVMVFVSRAAPSLFDKLKVSVANLILVLIIYTFLYFAPDIKSILKDSGVRIVTKVMGVILVAMAFMMLGEGVNAFLASRV